jgi:hypothetical protein
MIMMGVVRHLWLQQLTQRGGDGGSVQCVLLLEVRAKGGGVSAAFGAGQAAAVCSAEGVPCVQAALAVLCVERGWVCGGHSSRC